MRRTRNKTPISGLHKVPTGIHGLDEVTEGGLPAGRPTLVCGSAGCGKTLLAMEFLVRGATEFGEPGVLISFEERAQELADNVASLGFDVSALIAANKLAIDYVHIERSELEEAGEYDLEGLFVRLGYAIDTVGAKRVAIDTLEALFAGLPNEAILRAELRRLFGWLKDRGVTAVITAERGEGTLTRHGLEEYVSDCVILLDHRVRNQISTRRLRIVKYRGSVHGTNEYPFLIGEKGISVLPVTSATLGYAVSSERVSTGIEGLDEMLGGGGVYRGSSILVSGTPGAGKSSICATVTEAACKRGEKVVYFTFEESESQIVRNMRSIGMELSPHIRKGLLVFKATRPTAFGLEMHLLQMHRIIEDFQPRIVIVDPISVLLNVSEADETKALLIRLFDYLKQKEITGVFASLTHGGDHLETTGTWVSSLIDTWVVVAALEHQGERNRAIYVLKSRGMPHSNQVREFLVTSEGIRLVDVYVGDSGVLTGTARQTQIALEDAARADRQQAMQRRRQQLDRKRKILEAQIASMRADFEAEVVELNAELTAEARADERQAEARVDDARLRQSSGRTNNGRKARAGDLS